MSPITIPTYQLFKKDLSDTMNCSEAMTRQTNYGLTDTTNLSDSMTRLINYVMTLDTINASEAMTRLINYVMTDTMNISDSLSKLMYQTLSDTINMSDVMTAIEFVLEKGLRKDVSDIINEQGENVTIYTYVNTTDSSGGITASSETSDTGVTVLIQDMVAQDHDLLGKGIDYTGTAKMFAKYRYELTNNGSDYQIKPGDKIKRTYYDGTNRWDMTLRVEEVLRENVQETVIIFYEYLVRLIDITITADATAPTAGAEATARTDIGLIFDSRAELARLTVSSDTTDSMGGIITHTETTDYSVKVLIQDISARAREVIGQGINLTGHSTMFGLYNYDLTNSGDNYQIKPGDQIYSQARNATFHVETVVSFNIIGSGNAFMEYIVRRVENENIL